MHKLCTNYANYVTFTQNYAQIMQIMHNLCTTYALHALIIQKLRRNYARYAKITQKKLRKNYAYVCKLHNLHYYAPPTLLMLLLPL